jgi:hypothetical protein
MMGTATVWADGHSNAAQKVAKKYLPTLQKLAAEKTVIDDIQAQNALGMTAADAQALQDKWSKSIGIPEYVKPYLEKPSCKTMKAYMAQVPVMVKCFTLDGQGNIVGTVPKSHDFIHGTENKFTNCFNQGKGKVVVNPAQLDISTKIYSVQISVPVMSDSKTIGVLIATLSLE